MVTISLRQIKRKQNPTINYQVDFDILNLVSTDNSLADPIKTFIFSETLSAKPLFVGKFYPTDNKRGGRIRSGQGGHRYIFNKLIIFKKITLKHFKLCKKKRDFDII